MLEYLKNMANQTRTENGALTLRSTGSDCLNLFATIGACVHRMRLKLRSAFYAPLLRTRILP